VRAAEDAVTGEAKTEEAPVPGRLLPASAIGDANTCSRGVFDCQAPVVLLQLI